MPHVNSSGGDDLASTDEVKVYKDEGEEEKRSSENLSEDKLGLVTETEEDKHGENYGSEGKGGGSSQDGKDDHLDRPVSLGGYPLIPPYPYPNGASIPSPLGNKVSFPHPGALASLMMYNNEHFSSPPPAHMGIPPVHIDPKTGLPRPPMYPIPPPPGQFPHPFYNPDIANVQWNGPAGYPMTTAGLRSPYHSSITSSLARYSPGLLPPHPGMHPGINHPAIITPGPKQDIPHSPLTPDNHRHHSIHDHHRSNGHQDHEPPPEKKRPYVKKPLNAFMLFMKEQRAKVVSEGTLKESAAINQILGRKWHALDRSEQAKYYDMARKEKELHLQLYPGWSARDNYATHTKKKKRKREGNMGSENKDDDYMSREEVECTNPKKCRARFGLDQQNQWCKPCRRKKKCIRFLQGEDGSASNNEDDGEDGANSIATGESVTDDGESSQGSPMPPPPSLNSLDGALHRDHIRHQEHSTLPPPGTVPRAQPSSSAHQPHSQPGSSQSKNSNPMPSTSSLAVSSLVPPVLAT